MRLWTKLQISPNCTNFFHRQPNCRRCKHTPGCRIWAERCRRWVQMLVGEPPVAVSSVGFGLSGRVASFAERYVDGEYVVVTLVATVSCVDTPIATVPPDATLVQLCLVLTDILLKFLLGLHSLQRGLPLVLNHWQTRLVSQLWKLHQWNECCQMLHP